MGCELSHEMTISTTKSTSHKRKKKMTYTVIFLATAIGNNPYPDVAIGILNSIFSMEEIS